MKRLTNKLRPGGLQSEGRIARYFRRRRASKKILVPKAATQSLEKIGPVHTHQDAEIIEGVHGTTAAILSRDEQAAAEVHAELGQAKADEGAAEDGLRELKTEQARQVEHRDEFVAKVRAAGLGHKLTRHRGVTLAVGITVAMAIMFETISMSSPMSLLGVLDFGGSPHTQERTGAVLAFLLALGYAVVLAVLSKRAGAELKARHYRPLIEGEEAEDESTDDRPRTKHAVFADRMVLVAIVGGALALLAASVVREAAVGILAAAGQNQVQVSWWVFLALTLGVFIGLMALGYWSAAPIAKASDELEAGLKEIGKEVEAKRRECYRLAGRVDALRKRLRMIAAVSRADQLAQVHLALAHIAACNHANPHIHGHLTEAERIQNVIASPENYVRDLDVPTLEDTLTGRLDEIRHGTSPGGAPNPAAEIEAAQTAEPTAETGSSEEPLDSDGPLLPDTVSFTPDPAEAAKSMNGHHTLVA